MVILRTGVLLKNHLIPKQERRYQEINEEAPTLISLSIAVGKNGSRPLNHAVRELSPGLSHGGLCIECNALDHQHKAGRAALGLSCGACFELPNLVYFGSGAPQNDQF